MKILVVLLPCVGIPSITRVKTRVLRRRVHRVLATWLPADLRLCAPCDASGLAKGVPACGHTHTYVYCSCVSFPISCLFPDAGSQIHLVMSDLSASVQCLLTPPHAPPHSLIMCLLPPPLVLIPRSPPLEPLASSGHSAEGA